MFLVEMYFEPLEITWLTKKKKHFMDPLCQKQDLQLYLYKNNIPTLFYLLTNRSNISGCSTNQKDCRLSKTQGNQWP